ncbi:MAG: helix-turn-helix transcriptional regulator [Gemmatimonadetes bacterium]|nr:helix-turn-helix transcriptional regulator [Gemmatimonadota bacterium]
MENHGSNIRKIRNRRGIKSYQLAEKLGWSRTKMSLIESGERRLYFLDAERIAEALGVSIRELSSGVMICDMTFGGRIRQLRIDRGWSQDDVADRLSILSIQLSKWEQDETEPSATNIVRLARIFGVSVSFLLDGVDDRAAEDGTDADGTEDDQNLDFNAEIYALAAELLEADRKHPGMKEGFLLLLREGLLDTPEDREDLLSLVDIFQRRARRR